MLIFLSNILSKINTIGKLPIKQSLLLPNFMKTLEPFLSNIPESNGSRIFNKIDKRVGIICDEFLYEAYKDVVNLHFHKHADTILRTVERWAVSASRTCTHYPNQQLSFFLPRVRQHPVDFATILPQLQVTLQGYGATYVPQKIVPSHSQ